VGNHVAVHIAQDRTSVLLSEARQFEAYNRLTAFLMHDLNNLIAQQSLIVSNADTHKRNPDFVDDAMNTIAGSVDRMKRIMDQLKRSRSERDRKPTEIRFVASAAVDRCAGRQPQPTLVLDDAGVTVVADPEEFAMVLAHLIQNAQDSTSADGLVELRTHVVDGRLNIEVRDDGIGMSEEFVRDRLFRPFDSTKGSQGMGIGVYQAREFARKLGGELTVESRVGKGTTMTLALPVHVDSWAMPHQNADVD
jgi:putative PEP-CTERM system histidine kinase